jgi:hypothetical protein
MAISRMNMERQMRNMGGIMGLEDQRQGYFLGKLVKKITKPIKKIVKSPLGKAALFAAAANFAPALFGRQTLLKQAGGLGGLLGKIKGGEGMLGQIGNVFKVGGEADNPFSIFRVGGGLLGATALAAPFLMGDEEEVVDEESFTGPISSIESIRDQARQYYGDPTNSALYFMPPKSAVRSSFYAADGGLADIPREGYRIGGSAFGLPGLAIKAGQKAGEMFKAGIGKVKSLFDDADISVQIRDEDVMTDAGLQAQAVGQDVFITPKSKKAVQVIDGLIDEGYDIAKAEDGSYTISSIDEGALDLITQRLRIGSKGADEFIEGQDYMGGPLDEESKMIYDALRNRKAEGGLMDLGGMEKDYREGGFVPLGAEERADDVPARLSKNEFVFTADAVRNAGGGDIDKGAEVMQNMMDNLEAGGNISEESQGEENPAQAMFDQAQQLESRIA